MHRVHNNKEAWTTNRSSPRRFPVGALLLLAFALSGCGDDDPTGSLRGLVPCPATVSQAQAATIPITGGTVTVGGTSVTIPAGALTLPALIAVELPASQFDEVHLTANGLETFIFATPVTVALDYSRCEGDDLDRQPLTVWRIDPATKAFLEDMQGVDAKDQRKVTFQTGRFSSYALAY